MTSETPLTEMPNAARAAAVRAVSSFAVQLGSCRRSVQLARRMTIRHLAAWGIGRDTDAAHVVALVVAELCANAVTHGRVPGRDFRLHVAADLGKGAVRVEVSDASVELPQQPSATPAPDGDSGRGLLLVEALASRWGVTARDPIGKTVWAECLVP